MAMRKRLEAISILGCNIMKPRGLSGLAVDSLDVCKEEVKQTLLLFADESNYPILLHCTQGKDRTGLLVQLLLLLLSTPTDAINHDYMLTAPQLAPERDEKLTEVHSIGLPDEFADCDPKMVRVVDEHIRQNYGSISSYLAACGISEDIQSQLQKCLVGEAHPLSNQK